MQETTLEHVKAVQFWVLTPEQEAAYAETEEALASDPDLMAQYVSYLESITEVQ